MLARHRAVRVGMAVKALQGTLWKEQRSHEAAP